MATISFLLTLIVSFSSITAFPLGYRPVAQFMDDKFDDTKPSTCLAVAIQGGGGKGAFQAGGLQSLIKNLPPQETQYTSITGVSIGAVNSFGISVQSIDTPNFSQFISNIWHHFVIDQIMVSWDYGIIQGLLLHQSLFDYKFSQYIIKKYEKQFPNIERNLTVGAVNLKTGKFQLFNSTLGFQGMALAIQASSSIPFFFPPTKINDQYYIDGGSVYNVLPAQAIDQCVDMGYSIENTKVDVLMTHPFNITWKDMSFDKEGGLINLLQRVKQMRSHYQTVFELLYTMWEYPDAKWRYLIRPDGQIDEGLNPVDFSQDHINKIYQAGVDVGKQVVQMGQGASFDKFLQGEGKIINFGSVKTGGINESNRIKYMRQKIVFI